MSDRTLTAETLQTPDLAAVNVTWTEDGVITVANVHHRLQESESGLPAGTHSLAVFSSRTTFWSDEEIPVTALALSFH